MDTGLTVTAAGESLSARLKRRGSPGNRQRSLNGRIQHQGAVLLSLHTGPVGVVCWRNHVLGTARVTR